MKQIYPPFEESLLLSYLLGRVSPEEKGMIEEWLFAEDDHRRYLDQLEQLWSEAGKIIPEPVAVDVDAAWSGMSRKLQKNETPVKHLRYIWAAAAILVISFGIYFTTRLVLGPPSRVEIASSASVVKDTLPDGSRVTLNRDTKILYPKMFGKKTRSVALQGEAYFEVVTDMKHPFTVEAGVARIRVVGTSFNVRAYPGTETEVTVDKGLVMLYSIDPSTKDTHSVMLPAGTRGVLRSGTYKPEIAGDMIPDRMYWLDKRLEFRQTPLSEVFSVLSSRMGVPIRASDPAILNYRLSVTFENESLPTIIDVIATTFGLTAEDRGTYWYLYRNEKK